jgi:hypothetical protein
MTQLVDFGEGQRFVVRLITSWVNVEGETFEGTKNPITGSSVQIGPSSYETEPVRIEDATLVLTSPVAAQLTAQLLSGFSHFPQDVKSTIANMLKQLSPPTETPSSSKPAEPSSQPT